MSELFASQLYHCPADLEFVFPLVVENRLEHMPGFGEATFRIVSEPLVYKKYGNRMLLLRQVPAILEKEPLTLEDSRVWC